MMSKKDLSDKLKEALAVEEEAIPLYSGHLRAAVELAGIDDNTVLEIKRILEKLADDSRAHKGIIENIMDTIAKDGRDAF